MDAMNSVFVNGVGRRSQRKEDMGRSAESVAQANGRARIVICKRVPSFRLLQYTQHLLVLQGNRLVNTIYPSVAASPTEPYRHVIGIPILVAPSNTSDSLCQEAI